MREEGRALRFKTPQPIPRPQFVRSEFLVFALGPTHNERIQCTQSPAKRRRPEPPVVANPSSAITINRNRSSRSFGIHDHDPPESLITFAGIRPRPGRPSDFWILGGRATYCTPRLSAQATHVFMVFGRGAAGSPHNHADTSRSRTSRLFPATIPHCTSVMFCRSQSTSIDGRCALALCDGRWVFWTPPTTSSERIAT